MQTNSKRFVPIQAIGTNRGGCSSVGVDADAIRSTLSLAREEQEEQTKENPSIEDLAPPDEQTSTASSSPSPLSSEHEIQQQEEEPLCGTSSSHDDQGTVGASAPQHLLAHQDVTTCPDPESNSSDNYELYLRLNASINASLKKETKSSPDSQPSKAPPPPPQRASPPPSCFPSSPKKHHHHRHKNHPKPLRTVRFSTVRIRSYKTTIGDNPCCSYGPPLSLDWDYFEEHPSGIPVHFYEDAKSHLDAYTYRRKVSMILLNPTQRCARLFQAGYSTAQMKQAEKEIRIYQLSRGGVLNFCQEVYYLKLQPLLFGRYEHNQDELLQKRLQKIERKVRGEHASQASASVGGSIGNTSAGISKTSLFEFMGGNQNSSRNFNSREFGLPMTATSGTCAYFDKEEEEDVEKGGMPDFSHFDNRQQNKVIIEGMEGLSSNSGSGHSSSGRPRPGDISSIHSDSQQGDNEEEASSSVGILVDSKQHDKAIEIKLWSFRRPHMRAFHASWAGFFVAFFSWFSITPLLGEVKESLQLTNSDIWISSLVGTSGTVIMRLVMGPLCDRFGARLCMAFILISAAVPTALTGLIQSSVGLSLVRLFVGIGGSSFVACQYWTSDMFTREVAGTANALVAGWGNLGGGFAQLIMGSALFPLFRLFFGFDDDGAEEVYGMDGTTSSELAWRTVFLVPALLSVVTGVAILLYCDDSPTGSYRDRIQNETMMVINPMDSFCSATQNWNVWILALQYACCFGVEVTMTNATALYFKEEFGQSTVSAAGIASIFGFMNLFARGVGGFCSDWLQLHYGVRGRLLFQTTTLILEGIFVGCFAYAESLAGSIVTLLFLSIMVQCAEGSTFGIVPYVDRRFTGSVVGLVGSGGSLGAAIFSVFFVYLHYRPAFVIMGAFAVASSFLSFLLNTEKIGQMHEALSLEVGHHGAEGEHGLKNRPTELTSEG